MTFWLIIDTEADTEALSCSYLAQHLTGLLYGQRVHPIAFQVYFLFLKVEYAGLLVAAS